MSELRSPLIIPADVPHQLHNEFRTNLHALMTEQGNMLILAADHKLEHLNDDFYGTGIAQEAAHAHHFFSLAQSAHLGTLATQFGLIARYGTSYPDVNYIVKLNSKTNIIPLSAMDPLSRSWYSVDDVIALKQNIPTIRGIGYTVYLGSEHEQYMLHEAAQLITQAHRHGLVAIVWVYPRGKYVQEQVSLRFTAGAAGVANALGADAVKLQLPSERDATADEIIRVSVIAAGNTAIIASGGERISTDELLMTIKHHQACGIRGAAIGRNLYQRNTEEAQALAAKIRSLL
jgi:DhnA family fructose-bisphosphate aldolase class Ia